MKIWADAIHRKADLVNFTNKLFEEIKDEERKRVRILAEAQKRILNDPGEEDRNFYLQIISENTTIPVIQTDDKNNIQLTRNNNINTDSVKKLLGKLREEYTMYPPIVYTYYMNSKLYLYYKDSNIFTELKVVLDDLIRYFFSEVVMNSASVPVIVTDSTQMKIIRTRQYSREKKAGYCLSVRQTLEINGIAEYSDQG